MQPYEFTLGQIECAVLSERGSEEALRACHVLHDYLLERDAQMKGYQVQADQRLVKERKQAPPKKKLQTIDDIELTTCALVDE